MYGFKSSQGTDFSLSAWRQCSFVVVIVTAMQIGIVINIVRIHKSKELQH